MAASQRLPQPIAHPALSSPAAPSAAADAGILKYVDVDTLLQAALPSGAPAQPPPSQVTRTLL